MKTPLLALAALALTVGVMAATSDTPRKEKNNHFPLRVPVDRINPSITVYKLAPLSGSLPKDFASTWSLWCQDALQQVTASVPKEQKQFISSFGQVGSDVAGICCAFYQDADGVWLQYANDLLVKNLGLQSLGALQMKPNEVPVKTGQK